MRETNPRATLSYLIREPVTERLARITIEAETMADCHFLSMIEHAMGLQSMTYTTWKGWGVVDADEREP